MKTKITKENKTNKRYCKGCFADVTEDMMCYCGEFPLTKDATYSQDEVDELEGKRLSRKIKSKLK